MIERATLYAMANRLWGSASGLLTAVVVAAFFTPELQGYYFTFLSLLTLQTFVELGFGELLQQFVSHEWAKTTSTRPDERQRSLLRLAGLFRFSLRWYAGLALLLGAGLGIAGSAYFRTFSRGADGGAISWEAAWWVAVAATALSLPLVPWFSLLEGANRVERVHGVRLGQGLASRVAGLLAIVFGFGLFTIAVTRIVSFLVGLSGLAGEGLGIARRLWAHPLDGDAVSYRRELWPLQWKFALSWLSGYLLYSLFTPVLFAFHGPELAGRMGMTAAAASAVSSAAFAVMATKVPRLAILAAERDYSAMDALFRRASVSSLLVSAAGASLFLSSLALARSFDLEIAERFLPPLETFLFLAALVLQQVRYAMGSYLRAHKADPFVALSVVEGIAAVPLLALFGRAFGALGMILGFLALTTLTLFPAVRIFTRCRRAWHVPRLARAPS
jgi:O-antigen/teichoic acid export membrane protein